MDSKYGGGEGPGPGSGPGPSSGPKIIRPIPRRPFNLHRINTPTPPPEEDQQQQHGSSSKPTTPGISAHDLRFLDPRFQSSNGNGNLGGGGGDADTLSRATSFMNLTSSTLFGIYSPTTSGQGQDRDALNGATPDPATPWGTGAETPASRRPPPRGMVDDKTYAVIRERSEKTVPRLSSVMMARGGADAAAVVSSLVLRAALLFALGMGYGVLVTRFPSSGRGGIWLLLVPQTTVYADWRYLCFWGSAGVALGSLLPWFDQVWEETFGMRERQRRAAAAAAAAGKQATTEESTSSGRPEADWALVVRGIGAFVGIVFAIRRLPWTSTMQVSLTLALANPFLWYLIDRSKPGFLLSTTISLAGSAVLMSLGPNMMPAPVAAQLSTAASSLGTWGAGFASHERIETGIWMLSVLFCSCLCFGNIGRRLALNRSAAGRGRWGGVR
ncbi:insulin-induced protein-domain-containing protein [Bombardia bombarda]|uniref:Insulin-induced protein-domain-containing protein n=1 Tax=Bombardia bombarda TaxID=252184 RepID=A0AA40CH32_9PEZI|nr:insulin-induced protein-domain-containing protein [Bombardia bombarda]